MAETKYNRYQLADRIATYRNVTNWKGGKRFGWKWIQKKLKINYKQLHAIRRSPEYAFIIAKEVEWGAKNAIQFPLNPKDAFGIDEKTSDFLWQIRLNAGNQKVIDNLIDEFIENHAQQDVDWEELQKTLS